MKEITQEDILSAEISSYEEMLEKSAQLKGRVDEMVGQLCAAYSSVIGSKSIFEEIKKENIEEIRLFRQTIVRECSEIVSAVKQMKVIMDGKSLSDLKEYVALCERLNALQGSGFKFPSL
jgi:hypothetical protein